jgi:hypothetical protein
MGMKLKIDDKGVVSVTEHGHVVFVDDDGKDLPVDVPALYSKVEELNSEAAKYRKQRNEFRDKFKIFEGVEDIAKFKSDAEKAMATVKNFKDKELVDAGKVEQIKLETIAAKDQEINQIKTEFTTALTEKDRAIQEAQFQIRDLMIGAKFRQSNYFVGNENQPPKTLLPPDIAETYFGKHFKVEQGTNGKLIVIGYDSKGNQIYSRKKPGELAEFDEAIIRIVDEYPQKDQILRGGKGGSGGEGGSGGGPVKKVGIDAEIAKIQEAYNKAMTEKRGRDSVALKNRLHELQMKKMQGVTAV